MSYLINGKDELCESLNELKTVGIWDSRSSSLRRNGFRS